MFGKVGLIGLVSLVMGIIPGSTLAGTDQRAMSEENLSPQTRIKLGVEVLIESQLGLLQGKGVGLITNETGVDGNLKSTADILWEHPEVNLVAFFGPEHGIRGDAPAGEYVESYIDKKTGLPVFSLYGKTRKPTPDMLEGIDVLIFDIQDVGTRHYTYTSTMALAMEAAREKGIKFVVLDRPNPLGGVLVEGPLLEKGFESFVGMFPIPLVHGMTMGELARLFNDEFGIGANLTVVKMEGWRRDMFWEETGLPWIRPSPNIPTPLTAQVYPITGIIGELLGASIGIGTTRPFEYIGAPWIDAQGLAQKLNRQQLPGIHFYPIDFRPLSARYAGQLCHGIQIHILDKREFRPAKTSIHIITALKKLYPERVRFRPDPRKFDISIGTDRIRLELKAGKPPEEIIANWQDNLKTFLPLRRQFLLYD